ncbi:hypothetical protein EZV62_000555 [Acer yangbiense]|uniref:Uncharacterized protein n=1 Tax=Acer yangbiense TaxID=1000413 RepID=A0A5C7IU86_9ROSI|nr:hypothetical protein EZV62_000555 [Acer yangbiense]
MEEKRREREAHDDVNEKEMDVIEESDDVNEMEILEEKRREREAHDDVNEKEMDVIEESDDVNEMEILEEKRREILEAPLPRTPIKDIHVPVPQCCIYRVPKDLRKINEAAYTLQHDFTRDAVFIIEVFLKYWLQDGTFDFFLHTPTMLNAIDHELQLLENQLPYFVLQKLIEQGAFHNVTNEKNPDHDPLLILSHKFFLNSKPVVFPKPNYQIKHFTDLRRYFLLKNFCPEEEPGEMRDLPIATKLHRSGVKFKMGIEDSLEISFKDVKNAIRIPYLKSCELPIPWIKELELQISRFEVHDYTECLYRNMMALEQCHYPGETHICNFILVMDYLINTVEDVDLLVDEGIIVNC